MNTRRMSPRHGTFDLGKMLLWRLAPAVVVAICTVLTVAPTAKATHSPKEWYEESPLDDGNGNKVEDIIEGREALEMVDVVVCFLDDCIPPDRLTELAALGDVAYVSTVVSSVAVNNVTVADVLNVVTGWAEVGYIHLDHVVEAHMNTAGQALKAHAGFYSPNTAEDAGFDGTGISIAVLDTGVDDPGGPGTTHDHLPAGVGAPGVPGLYIDATNTLAFGNPDDEQGHGTAVAGCALGRGAPGNIDRGTAWGASLFDCRITPPGAGGTTASSNIQQVVDWLTWNYDTVVPPVRVANISFGSNTPSTGSALTASIEALVASGVVVTVSAGNGGPTLEGSGVLPSLRERSPLRRPTTKTPSTAWAM